ncbi:hypothetical protein OEZ84_28085, partial [Leclercia adecarboxylata]|nr:hypothetical protein [Leclercia adecarboxylata]
VTLTGRLLAAAQRFGQILGKRVERAAGSRRDQQSVPAGGGRERREKQQTAQRQDAAGADHEIWRPEEQGGNERLERASRHIMDKLQSAYKAFNRLPSAFYATAA